MTGKLPITSFDSIHQDLLIFVRIRARHARLLRKILVLDGGAGYRLR